MLCCDLLTMRCTSVAVMTRQYETYGERRRGKTTGADWTHAASPLTITRPFTYDWSGGMIWCSAHLDGRSMH